MKNCTQTPQKNIKALTVTKSLWDISKMLLQINSFKISSAKSPMIVFYNTVETESKNMLQANRNNTKMW